MQEGFIITKIDRKRPPWRGPRRPRRRCVGAWTNFSNLVRMIPILTCPATPPPGPRSPARGWGTRQPTYQTPTTPAATTTRRAGHQLRAQAGAEADGHDHHRDGDDLRPARHAEPGPAVLHHLAHHRQGQHPPLEPRARPGKGPRRQHEEAGGRQAGHDNADGCRARRRGSRPPSTPLGRRPAGPSPARVADCSRGSVTRPGRPRRAP